MYIQCACYFFGKSKLLYEYFVTIVYVQIVDRMMFEHYQNVLLRRIGKNIEETNYALSIKKIKKYKSNCKVINKIAI